MFHNEILSKHNINIIKKDGHVYGLFIGFFWCMLNLQVFFGGGVCQNIWLSFGIICQNRYWCGFKADAGA